MKHVIILYLTSLLILQSLQTFSQNIDTFNQQADKFFEKYVMKGNVDYKNLKGNFNEVDQLYVAIKSIDTKNFNENELKAFYINAYNIIVIHQITQYFPLKSALDRNGFFDKVKHNVAGESLTLDQVEKGKVILKFKDPRVHFAFSCAAAGCPELVNFAFDADKLEQQLEERTRNAINNDNFIKVNNTTKEVSLSMIFKWYENEFIEGSPSVLAYINQYRTQKIPDNYTVKFYDYDWSLNAL